jgi:hypothetical protein
MKKQRSVLLDRSFVLALLATDDPAHSSAKRIYATLVDRYEGGDDLLFAASTVLQDVPREFRSVTLAPVVTLWVAHQHSVAARRVRDSVTPEVAIELVLLQRERIRTVATASSVFDRYDLTILRAGTMPEPDLSAEAMGAAADDDELVSSRTEPQPGQRSTAE